jgi:hypothetical protein
MRTTKSTVVFAHPFRVALDGETFPAGSYDLETDEEAFESNGPTVYVRVATLLFVKTGTTTSVHTVDPAMLADALMADAAKPKAVGAG